MTIRWQYGVRWRDASETWCWSGRTSRAMAEACLEDYQYDHGQAYLIRRQVDIVGHVIGPSELVVDDLL